MGKEKQTIVDESPLFMFDEEQQKQVAEHFGYYLRELEYYEVCELLDRLIDETTTNFKF